jgi:putative ABC transport system permease protein
VVLFTGRKRKPGKKARSYSMNKDDILRLAYRSLMRRKARTILTILGVVIGTASIVVMISLGIGMNESQRRSMEQWGSLNTIRVHSGMRWDEEGNPIGEAKALNDEAVAELRSLAGMAAVSPVVEAWSEAKWGRKQGHINIIGLDPTQMEALDFSVAAGRLLDEYDRNAIVVGSLVADNFWDEREMRQRDGMMFRGSPMEQQRTDSTEMLDQRITLTVRGMSGEQSRTRIFNFQVVGVLDDSNMEQAWQVYAPIEDVRRINDFMNQGGSTQTIREIAVKQGTSSRNSNQQQNDYSYILAQAKDVEAAKELSKTLRDMGYNAYSMADGLEGIERIARIMQAILGGIGGISLFVAAIGITNTMVMSIYERTKEIGIMKVIGASFNDIQLLFLSEAGLIGFGGGVIGLVLSYLISFLLNHFGSGFIFGGGAMPGEEVSISIIPLSLALFAVGFALLVGVLSGLYPARRAMKLSPVVAIRNE